MRKIRISHYSVLAVTALAALVLSGCVPKTKPSASFTSNNGDAKACTINSNPYGITVGQDSTIPFPMVGDIKPELNAEVTYKYNKKDLATNELKETDLKPPVKYYGVGFAYITDVKLAEGRADCAENHLGSLTDSQACKDKLPYSKIEISGQSYQVGGDVFFMRMNYRDEKLDADGSEPDGEAEVLNIYKAAIRASENEEIIPDVSRANIYDVIFVKNEGHTENCGKGGAVFDVMVSSFAREDFTKAQAYRMPTGGGTIDYTNPESKTVKLDKISIKQILEYCGDNMAAVQGDITVEQINLGSAAPVASKPEGKGPPKTITFDAIKSIKDKFGDIDKDRSYLKYGGKITDEPVAHNNEQYNIEQVDAAGLAELKKIKELERATEARLLIDKIGGGERATALYVKIGSGWVSYTLTTPTTTIPNPEGCTNSGDPNAVKICNVPVSTNTDLGEAPWCGFTPECKPAIYLYPKKKTDVNVKIGPSVGIRTLTIPDYDAENGWNVTANRKGDISVGGQKFSHLFYEALTPTPTYPQAGWVIDGKKLSRELYKIARGSRLNRKEAKEFRDYWTKKLSPSNYYFVGWVGLDEIDKLEPIDISPKPDTLWRVRYYFVPLTDKIDVVKPNISKLKRKGFTAVEWGGWAVK